MMVLQKVRASVKTKNKQKNLKVIILMCISFWYLTMGCGLMEHEKFQVLTKIIPKPAYQESIYFTYFQK